MITTPGTITHSHQKTLFKIQNIILLCLRLEGKIQGTTLRVSGQIRVVNTDGSDLDQNGNFLCVKSLLIIQI